MSCSELDIVLVTYNSGPWILRCLSSLPAALSGVTAQIIVVDNASSDGGADLVESYDPKVILVRNSINAGFGAAVNSGVEHGRAPWILLLNPDMEARPGSLRALLQFAKNHPGHGLYGGRTLTQDGDLEPSSCWALPTLWSMLCFALGLSTAFPRSRLFDPESFGRWQRDSVREVGMVTGCLLLVERGIWRRLGGFDERFFVYGEDADLAARARVLGYRPIITPSAEVIHAVGKSSSGAAGSLPLVLAGRITYFRTHFRASKGMLAVALLRAGVGLRALGSRFTGRSGKWKATWHRRSEWWNGFQSRKS